MAKISGKNDPKVILFIIILISISITGCLIEMPHSHQHFDNPHLLKLNDNRILLVYDSEIIVSDDWDSEIYYSLFDGTWSEPKKITDNNVIDEKPIAVQLEDGRIFVFYQSWMGSGIDICFSIFDGVNWSEEKKLTGDEEKIYEEFDISVLSSNEKIWIVWTAFQKIFCKIYDGERWSETIEVVELRGGPSITSITEMEDGRIIVAFHSEDGGWRDNIYISIYENGKFSEPIQVTSENENKFPHVFSIENKIIIVWFINDAKGNYTLSSVTFDGETFSEPLTLDLNHGKSTHGRKIIKLDDAIYAFWQTYGTINFVKYEDRNWSEKETMHLEDCYTPSFELLDDKIMVVFRTSYAGTNGIYYVTYDGKFVSEPKEVVVSHEEDYLNPMEKRYRYFAVGLYSLMIFYVV